MVSELKNFQSQVHAYKFEIERINAQIQQTKQTYFQIMRQKNLGIVPEMDEEAYYEQEMQQ